MVQGQISVADNDGVYVIKLEGDVRLTLSISFDEFIENMFAKKQFFSVLFDLTGAKAIDSTTLGLMAKISIGMQQREWDQPIVVTDNPSMLKLLSSMGFDDIFQIVSPSEVDVVLDKPYALEERTDELGVTKRVLEAHRTLMQLNESNSETFKELVEGLEGEEQGRLSALAHKYY